MIAAALAVDVIHDIAGSLRGGGDGMGGRVGTEEGVLPESRYDRVERIVHRQKHHGPAARIRKRVGGRRIDRERVVLAQLAPSDHDGGTGELVCAVVVVTRFNRNAVGPGGYL